MASTPWWQEPVTQAFNPPIEFGVDLGTPFHDLLTAILPGQVQRVDCSVPYACEVDIATSWQGQQATESFLHVDVPEVTVGQQLAAGAAVGLSGGEITALPGAQHVDSATVSSGPHTEFDLFGSTTPFRNPIDPTTLVRGGPGASAQLLGTGPGGLPTPGDLASAVEQGVMSAAGQLAGAVGSGIGQGLSTAATSVGHGVANAGAGLWQNVQIFAARNLVALVVAAVVVAILFL